MGVDARDELRVFRFDHDRPTFCSDNQTNLDPDIEKLWIGSGSSKLHLDNLLGYAVNNGWNQ